jgi:hypothetical protein
VFSFRQAVGGAIHRVLVRRERLCDARSAVACEVDHARPAVSGIGRARHQTARLKAIDRRGNRPTREIDTPISLTDCGPLWSSTSSTPKSEMQLPSLNHHCRFSVY